MDYRLFYTDYEDDKDVSSVSPLKMDLKDIVHNMETILTRPDNFLGIINQQQQTLQFVAEGDGSVTIDIPVVMEGEYVDSIQKNSSLAECIELVRSLDGTEDFYRLFPGLEELLVVDRPWWKFW